MRSATIAPPAPSPQAGVSPAQPATLAATPFVRASSEHVEPAVLDRTVTPGAGAQPLGQTSIPAFGYLRSILLLVEATGGTGAAATYREDAPWSALSAISIIDVNGGQLFGEVSGYEAFLIHKWGGGPAFQPDPANSPAYVAPATTGNFSFMLRLPIEQSNRDAVGSLPNGNSSATFKLNVTVAALTDIYAVNPTGIPTIRVRAWMEAWAQPEPGLGNLANEMEPPATGTTMFWNRQIVNVSAGQQTVPLTRLGNYIRNLILIFRTTAPARNDSSFPDPLLMLWDSVQLVNQPRILQKHYMRERFGQAPDTGVFCFDYMHEFDGSGGHELRDLWLPTLTSSRIEFQGSFGAAGVVTILTNDVAVPAGQSVFTD